MKKFLKDFPDHIFMATSGTTSNLEKWVMLSPQAMEASAYAVNKHLRTNKNDIWFQCLPKSHVGGLSIYTRAKLSDSQVVEYVDIKWNVDQFYSALKVSSATLCSLVPTQVFDLVLKGYSSPPSLRAVVVGGAALSESLYFKARKLRWPLLPSFGMTEASSQIATAGLESLDVHDSYPDLRLLSHIEAKTDFDDILHIKSSSLMSGYVFLSADGGYDLVNPIKHGWFKTEDRAVLKDALLNPLGRVSDTIKISGELVSVKRLEDVFSEVLLEIGSQNMALRVAEDERRGHSIELIYEDRTDTHAVKAALNKYNERVRPFEKIMSKMPVDTIERTALGKVKKLDF